MGTYLLRRFVLMVVTLFGISVLVFVMLRVVPGNIADILFDAAGMINPAEKAELEKALGLDRPIVVTGIARRFDRAEIARTHPEREAETGTERGGKAL